jgi:hypothetical protein
MPLYHGFSNRVAPKVNTSPPALVEPFAKTEPNSVPIKCVFVILMSRIFFCRGALCNCCLFCCCLCFRCNLRLIECRSACSFDVKPFSTNLRSNASRSEGQSRKVSRHNCRISFVQPRQHLSQMYDIRYYGHGNNVYF